MTVIVWRNIMKRSCLENQRSFYFKKRKKTAYFQL